MRELPGDALRRYGLAVDLHLSGPVSLLGARPQMMLAGAIHLGLEPLPEGGHPRPLSRFVGVLGLRTAVRFRNDVDE
jgi:hypothetical protein